MVKSESKSRGRIRSRSRSGSKPQSPRDVAEASWGMLSSPSASRSRSGARHSRSVSRSGSRPRSATPPRGGKPLRTARGWRNVKPQTVGARRKMPTGCFIEPDEDPGKRRRQPKYPVCPAKGKNKDTITSQGLLAAAQRAYLNIRSMSRKGEELKAQRHRFVLARVLRIAMSERAKAMRAAGKDEAKRKDANNYWIWVDVRNPDSNQVRRFCEEALGLPSTSRKTKNKSGRNESPSRSKASASRKTK